MKTPIGIVIISLFVGWSTYRTGMGILFRRDGDYKLFTSLNLEYLYWTMGTVLLALGLGTIFSLVKKYKIGYRLLQLYFILGPIHLFFVTYLYSKNLHIIGESYVARRQKYGIEVLPEDVQAVINSPVVMYSMYGAAIVLSLFAIWAIWYIRKHRACFSY